MYQKSQIEDNTMTKIKYQRDKQKPSIVHFIILNLYFAATSPVWPFSNVPFAGSEKLYF